MHVLNPRFQLTTAVEFTVPGNVAWARAGANGSFRFTPAVQKQAMTDCQWLARCAMKGRSLFYGPVSLELTVTWPAPKSWPKDRRETETWQASRPDADNLAKLYADAMQNVVYHNDAQIVRLLVLKLIGEQAEVRVKVEEL